MSKFSGANPVVLKWAREALGYSIDDVAKKLNKDITILESWESGESSPTYVQLEKLAYEIYKRPIAIFFFPNPPKEMDLKRSFRTLPEAEINSLNPDTFMKIRLARSSQLSLKELTDNRNPATKKIFKELKINVKDPLHHVARQARDFLNITLNDQAQWKDIDESLKFWRQAVEDSGVFVFKQSFKQEDVSGFCLNDDENEFPVVFINNSTAKSRQIFTLFHELAHILLQANGITFRKMDYVENIQGDSREIEVFCNAFASEFLVPSDDFHQYLKQDPDDKFIDELAFRYKVSKEVILRRFLDKGAVTQGFYQKKSEAWIAGYHRYRENKKSSGGNYYANQITYLGKNYLQLVFEKSYHKGLSTQQIADYLNINPRSVSNLEHYFLSMGK